MSVNQQPRRFILAGGNGFMGRALTSALVSRGDEVVILTRSPSNQSRERVREVQWDAKTVGSWKNELDGAHAIVNLVGRTVDCRKIEIDSIPIHRRSKIMYH